MSFSKQYTFIMAVLAAIFFTFKIGTSNITNILSYDVFGYYLYLPATFIYGDITISDLSWVNEVVNTYQNTPTLYQLVPLENGNHSILYFTGMAMLYFPFFLLGHLVAWLLEYPMDGFSYPYQAAIIASSWFYTVAGIFILRKLLLRYFSDKISAITMFVLIFGTNYLQQNFGGVAMSHNYLFALYGLYFFHVDRWFRTFKKKHAIWFGAIAGVMILARPSEIICLLIPLFWVKTDSIKQFKESHLNWFKWAIIPLGIFAIVQMLYWQVTTGRPIFYSYSSAGQGFDFFSPHTLDFLFSYRKGWILYTPLILGSFIGFYFLRKENNSLFKIILPFIVLNIFFLSSWTTWWYAASFSQRPVVQSYILLAIPLASFINWSILNRIRSTVIFAIMLSLVGLNIFQTWQYGKGIIHHDRMTKTAYWRNFLRTSELQLEDEQFLLVKRSESVVDIMPKKVVKTKEFLLDFETDINEREESLLTTIIRRLVKTPQVDFNQFVEENQSNKYFRLTPERLYSASLDIPFNELCDKPHAWLKVSAKVFNNSDEANFFLVSTFMHGNGNYKYRTLSSKNISKTTNSWYDVSMVYLTPEIRSKEDIFRTYLWNDGSEDIVVDDLRIEVFESIQVYP